MWVEPSAVQNGSNKSKNFVDIIFIELYYIYVFKLKIQLKDLSQNEELSFYNIGFAFSFFTCARRESTTRAEDFSSQSKKDWGNQV